MKMRSARFLSTSAVAALAVTSMVAVVVPRSASAAPAAIEPALLWIEGELANNAGTLPSSFAPSTTDWGLTLDAVLALNVGGRGAQTAATTATTAAAAHINDYITGDGFGDVGSSYAGPIGKSLLAAALQNADVHAFGGVDLEATSRARVQATGMFAGRFSDTSTFGDYSNGFGQALNIMGLSRTTNGVPAAAATFLLAQQCPAGGFRLYYDATAPAVSTRGCASDVEADSDATAFALSALVTVTPSAERSAAISRATTWLLTRQDPATGGFGGTGLTVNPNANTTGLAVRALRAVGQVSAPALGAGYLGSVQLDTARATGTPAAAEVGAIARDQGAFDAAIAGGITSLARDQWRRATTQAVLALALPAFGVARSDVIAVSPARLLDTRPGGSTIDGAQLGAGPSASGTVLTLPVAGRAGIPTDANAVVLNVTATNATDAGYVTVYPCDAPRPLASNLNFVATTPTPNAVITKLSTTGTICLYVSGSTADLITDISGYFG